MDRSDLIFHNICEFLDAPFEDLLTESAKENFSGTLNNIAHHAVPDGYWLSRIPDDLRRSLNDSAQRNALQATGAELRFGLKSDSASITLQCPQQPVIAEVYQGPFLVSWHVIQQEPTTIHIAHPESLELLGHLHQKNRLAFDPAMTRVLLPWRPPIKLIDIHGEVALPQPDQAPDKTYLAYGSSITHGNCSVRPSGMYAQRAATNLEADLINLGFGGGAHLEPQMADYIAERDDWDFASLEMGINVLGIETDDFAQRVDYFVSRISDAHPDKWIFCIDLFTCRADLVGDWKPREFRAIVKTKVESMNRKNVVYLNGRELLSSLNGLTVDLVHPSPHGMEQIGRNLATALKAAME